MKSKKNPGLNTRKVDDGKAGQVGHGSRSPKDLGPVGNNQQKPGRHPVSLRPANADRDFDAGQHGEEK